MMWAMKSGVIHLSTMATRCGTRLMEMTHELGKRVGQVEVRELTDLLDPDRFHWPKQNGTALSRRVIMNIAYFQGNYVIIYLLSIAVVCLYHPLFFATVLLGLVAKMDSVMD